MSVPLCSAPHILLLLLLLHSILCTFLWIWCSMKRQCCMRHMILHCKNSVYVCVCETRSQVADLQIDWWLDAREDRVSEEEEVDDDDTTMSIYLYIRWTTKGARRGFREEIGCTSMNTVSAVTASFYPRTTSHSVSHDSILISCLFFYPLHI